MRATDNHNTSGLRNNKGERQRNKGNDNKRQEYGTKFSGQEYYHKDG